MSYQMFFTIIVVGLSGIVAQVMLLRELSISFLGNELTLGVILANWLIAEAAGVLIIGKYIDKIKNKVNIFIILQLLFCIFLPLAIYFARTFKGMLGVPTGEAIGLYAIFFASFFVVLPSAFCHGALFSALCRLYSNIGRVYVWEMIGTVLGGAILTYALIPLFNYFQIAFLICAANIVVCLIFLKNTAGKLIRYSVLVALALFCYVFMTDVSGSIQKFSLSRQWQAGKILEYRNSVYGNIAILQRQEQRTFFYNGQPIITTPYPDTISAEEFAHLPLLFHQLPKDILIISGGAGGLINEVRKHPINSIDYVELDPLIMRMLKRHPSSLTDAELSDKRVNIINGDGRLFLKTTCKHYDVVLLGLSSPADLSTNRFFTQEAFMLIKNKLKPGGILAFRLPGSLGYLSRQLRDLNACILNTLSNIYAYTRVIPGDSNLFFASDSDGILKADAALITKKISLLGIKTNVLLPDYLEYRLSPKWVNWFNQSLRGATHHINRDFAPFAVFQMLIYWNNQFSSSLAGFLELFSGLSLKIILIFVFALTLFLYLLRLKTKASVAYCIAATGFFGMISSLVLMFSYQSLLGYLYHRIGLLISLFMMGACLGGILMTRRLKDIKKGLVLFIKLEVVIVLFSLILAFGLNYCSGIMQGFPLIFAVLFILSGFLMGLEFPLAGKLISGRDENIGETAGILYFSDLMGGWAAGNPGRHCAFAGFGII
jgi:spermidine synthase